MNYHDFFKQATGNDPYPYQAKLAEASWPDLLEVPTGLGKTAAVALAWLYRRREMNDPEMPRRLVWCLPMRVLVEQTAENIEAWLKSLNLHGKPGEGKVSVNILMGGESDLKSWAEHPEEEMILVGTQDMLLSRALMRGYGMSRYQWPIHFALLHNDCLWAFDEVQLMGAGLATSTQLDAFRREFPLAQASRSLWISATLNRDWLDTVDMRPHMDSLITSTIDDEDRVQAGDRLGAIKILKQASVSLTKYANNKQGLDAYLDALSELVLKQHDETAQTLVIVNRVDRAQQLFRKLRAMRESKSDLLVHARFRAAERAEQSRRLREGPNTDRIVVATQAIEAGVDMSSKTLITELAPWSSLVQRFGRCNRYGEHNANGAHIFWVDIEQDADALPYDDETLAQSREKLGQLDNAGPQGLPATDSQRPLCAVLRRKDLLDLFNTDPDLSGFDVDVSDYIRDTGTPGVQVFWREFGEDPNTPEPQPRPERAELCPVSIGQAKALAKRKDVTLWRWDTLDDAWIRLNRDPRPGMTILIRASDGGYDQQVGFDAAIRKPPVTIVALEEPTAQNAFGEDWRSRQSRAIALTDHLSHVAAEVKNLCTAVGEATHADAVIRSGRWHDLGKAHEVFDATMHVCEAAPPGFLAKSPCGGRHSRPFFRHELASMLAWLAQHDGEPEADLVAYLIAAHHGKVRMSLRAMPTERAEKGVKRFARGVWEGDVLPALDFDGEHSKETTLKLALMELGECEQGPSWTARTLRLLDNHGPFQLAWLETLVRLADWRASRDEQLDSPACDNNTHELDNSHSPVAAPEPRAAATDSPSSSAAKSCAQHGLRGRAGEPANAGSRTRPPHAATRFLDTTLGVLSYSELAPHLARRVEALQNSIAEGEFDQHKLDEALFLQFHQRICGDLTPDFSGRWRASDVIVGSHEPPPHHRVAQAMHAYAQDLAVRIEHLPTEPNDLWLETLAFAEGRLLSIHPFTDFNGRVSRVFVDWLTRRLDLPDVDPTPDEGEATTRYLAALRAGDRHDWQPLMEIWRERFEKGVDA